jgi:hypothetical protein
MHRANADRVRGRAGRFLPIGPRERPGPLGRRISLVTEKAGAAIRATELSLVVAAMFWGANYAATKYAAGFLPPTFLVALRFAGGGLLLLIVLRLLEPWSRLARG